MKYFPKLLYISLVWRGEMPAWQARPQGKHVKGKGAYYPFCSLKIARVLDISPFVLKNWRKLRSLRIVQQRRGEFIRERASIRSFTVFKSPQNSTGGGLKPKNLQIRYLFYQSLFQYFSIFRVVS